MRIDWGRLFELLLVMTQQLLLGMRWLTGKLSTPLLVEETGGHWKDPAATRPRDLKFDDSWKLIGTRNIHIEHLNGLLARNGVLSLPFRNQDFTRQCLDPRDHISVAASPTSYANKTGPSHGYQDCSYVFACKIIPNS